MDLRVCFCIVFAFYNVSAYHLAIENYESEEEIVTLFTDYIDEKCVKEKSEEIHQVIEGVQTCIVLQITPILQSFTQTEDYVETVVNITCSDTTRRMLNCIATGQEEILKFCECKEQEENTAIVLKLLHEMINYMCSHKKQFKETIKNIEVLKGTFNDVQTCWKKVEGAQKIGFVKRFAFDDEDCKQDGVFIKCLVSKWNNDPEKEFVRNLILNTAKSVPYCDYGLDDTKLDK